MKGVAAAALIAGSFFVFKQRLPMAEDLTGITALTTVCVIGSLSEKRSDMAAEEFLGRQSGEQKFEVT